VDDNVRIKFLFGNENLRFLFNENILLLLLLLFLVGEGVNKLDIHDLVVSNYYYCIHYTFILWFLKTFFYFINRYLIIWMRITEYQITTAA